MKRQQRYFKPSSFRFRRWSRKGYAAFFSLKRAVTIGQLSSNVSERFQVKNGSNHSSVLVAGRIRTEETGTVTDSSQEQSETESFAWLSHLLLLLFSLPTGKQTSVAASRVHYIICHLNSGVSNVLKGTPMTLIRQMTADYLFSRISICGYLPDLCYRRALWGRMAHPFLIPKNKAI